MREVDVNDLSVVLDDGSKVVDRVSLQLDSGKVMGVVGESGSGKSTLALALLGFTKPGATISDGRIVVDGVNLLALSPKELRHARKQSMGFVPQDPATALNPAIRIGTQMVEGLVGGKAANMSTIREVLETVGLPSSDSFLRRLPRQLSGGQQQRVTIAMAVAKGPRLIVLDEPTTGLDVSTQAVVLEMVGRLCRDRDMAAVFVSHDLAAVGSVGDFVTVMYGGETVETGPSERVVYAPAHPYTIALLNSVPSTTERLRLRSIPGHPPAPTSRHTGCVFADRCAFAEDDCTRQSPALVTLGEHHVRCRRTDHVRDHKSTVSAVRESGERPGLDRQPCLTVRNLNASYDGNQVLFEVSADVIPGECLAIVGESGSGKTTMSRCLIGLHDEQSAEYWLDGEVLPTHLRSRNNTVKRELQYIFQNPFGSLNPRQTVAGSVSIPLKHFFGESGKSAQARVREALDRVEIPWRLANRYPSELSGGERQRVAIARALVCDPRVLICDEVTSALDVSVQAAVIEMLKSLLSDSLSMLFVTHDLAVVRSIADSVMVLRAGHTVESDSTESVLTTPTHEYTRGLIADAPEIRSPALLDDDPVDAVANQPTD